MTHPVSQIQWKGWYRRTSNENARRELGQIGRAPIWSVNERRHATNTIPGRIVPEAPCETATGTYEEHDIPLARVVQAGQLGNACDGEWVRLAWYVANCGQDDVGVLARTPVHLAAECHTHCVGRDQLDGRGAVVTVFATASSIIPYKACSAQNAIERPDDQCGPEVVAVAVIADVASAPDLCYKVVEELTSLLGHADSHR